MNIPKPHPPKKTITPPLEEKPSTPIASPSEEMVKIGEQLSEEKREFLLKPHLTQRPFRNPDMAALRKVLEGKR